MSSDSEEEFRIVKGQANQGNKISKFMSFNNGNVSGYFNFFKFLMESNVLLKSPPSPSIAQYAPRGLKSLIIVLITLNKNDTNYFIITV